MYKTIQLKKGKEDSLKRFHPWIFSGAIQRIDEGISEGDTVRVITSQGEFIAIHTYTMAKRNINVPIIRNVLLFFIRYHLLNIQLSFLIWVNHIYF